MPYKDCDPKKKKNCNTQIVSTYFFLARPIFLPNLNWNLEGKVSKGRKKEKGELRCLYAMQ